MNLRRVAIARRYLLEPGGRPDCVAVSTTTDVVSTTIDGSRVGMSTCSGFAVDAWVAIDGGHPITCEIVGDEAHFGIGTRAATVTLIASEEGLDKFVSTASEALRAMRAPDDQGHSQ